MDVFSINGEEFRITKSGLESNIQNEILTVNEKYYKKLLHLLEASEGEYVKQMKQQLKAEYEMIAGLGELYLKILSYMKESVEQAEELDRKYSVQNFMKGIID